MFDLRLPRLDETHDIFGCDQLVELPEQLVFSNVGSFLPGTVEQLLTSDGSPAQYRNPCLTQAMVALKLIDTVGSGIRRMYIEQRNRFFPLPDYLIKALRARKLIEGRAPNHLVSAKVADVLV